MGQYSSKMNLTTVLSRPVTRYNTVKDGKEFIHIEIIFPEKRLGSTNWYLMVGNMKSDKSVRILGPKATPFTDIAEKCIQTVKWEHPDSDLKTDDNLMVAGRFVTVHPEDAIGIINIDCFGVQLTLFEHNERIRIQVNDWYRCSESEAQLRKDLGIGWDVLMIQGELGEIVTRLKHNGEEEETENKVDESETEENSDAVKNPIDVVKNDEVNHIQISPLKRKISHGESDAEINKNQKTDDFIQQNKTN
jgi:hypothetical protein